MTNIIGILFDTRKDIEAGLFYMKTDKALNVGASVVCPCTFTRSGFSIGVVREVDCKEDTDQFYRQITDVIFNPVKKKPLPFEKVEVKTEKVRVPTEKVATPTEKVKAPKKKVSAKKVSDIKDLLDRGVPQTVIAGIIGVSPSTVSNINVYG